MASADVDIMARPYWQDPSALDPTRARPSTNNAPDGLDDLFNYNVDIDETSRAVNAEASANGPAQTSRRERHTDMEDNGGLGIDEEVKVRKRRAPVARLDEDRLLSANGIPKLRRIAKERMKFKGKGHEFSDVSRILNIYQLWLDELFPKAKFMDGLAIIEKLGHKKRLQVMRKEWIDEEKPKPALDELSDPDNDFVNNTLKDTAARGRAGDDRHSHAENRAEQTAQQDDSADEDLYAEPTPPPQAPAHVDTTAAINPAEVDAPDDDELDALLAEETANEAAPQITHYTPRPRLEDDFADEEEAMAGMW